MAATYFAAVLEEPQHIEIRKRQVELPLAAHEVLIEVAYAGVCGTDVAIYSGNYRVPLPLVLGHEFSGRVVDAGRGREARALLGKRVVAEINATCVARRSRTLCAACRRGLVNHCQRRSVVGIVNHDGAFAQFVRVPVGCVHSLPDSIALDAAIFVEPLAAAIRTFELSAPEGGGWIVVLGAGRLGKLVTLVAAKYGYRVIAVTRRATSLFPLKDLFTRGVCFDGEGAHSGSRGKIISVQSEDELAMLVSHWTKGLGADMVVEATGDPQKLTLASKLVRPQGTIALKSTPGVPTRSLDTTMLAVDEVRLQGSRCGPFEKAIQFMVEHGMPTAGWITARFSLEKTAESIHAAQYEAKVVIEISPSASRTQMHKANMQG
ncbi:MAG: alcohol dehydrogenase catalytic domain-containing protein [Candidatus Sumerlaeaceae bacterium]|jgi:threonine dehydrogenase-like Zn-dependent dehydrogenase